MPLVVLVIASVLISANLAAAQPLGYTIADRESFDVPAKSQAVLHIVVNGQLTRASLEELLNRVYRETAATPSKHHGRVTHVAVFAYETEAHARAGMAQWIGMIRRIGSSGRVELEIRGDRLAAMGRPSEKRFGLSEDQRKDAWREKVTASDRAIRDAMTKYPDPPPSAGRDQVAATLRRQTEYQRGLVKEAEAAITKRYKITADQLLQISVEAHEKNWPFPK